MTKEPDENGDVVEKWLVGLAADDAVRQAIAVHSFDRLKSLRNKKYATLYICICSCFQVLKTQTAMWRACTNKVYSRTPSNIRMSRMSR